MNPFFLRRLLHYLAGAFVHLDHARRCARTRGLWPEASCYTRALIYRLRDALRRSALLAVKYARAAYVLLSVEVLRSHYQLELFPL